MKLIIHPNKKLRLRSKEVELPLSDDDIKLAEAMINHIDSSYDDDNDLRPGVGIAAIQFGVPKRMFYVNFDDGKTFYRDLLVNPVLVAESPTFAALEGGEGCLSVDESMEDGSLVHRKYRVIMKGYSYFDKTEKEYDLTGYPAIVFQHELDHLNGKLFIDRVDHKNPVQPKPGEVVL